MYPIVNYFIKIIKNEIFFYICISMKVTEKRKLKTKTAAAIILKISLFKNPFFNSQGTIIRD